MIAIIEFDTWHDSWKQLSDENYQRLRAHISSLPESKPDWFSTHCMVDLTELSPLITELALELKLHPYRNGMIVTLKDRVHRLESDMKLTRAQLASDGSIVQVHVPNIGLIAMNEVKVLDDACTDTLQEALDEGWSLLAICPPNAQRRPDYILGRSNPRRSLLA